MLKKLLNFLNRNKIKKHSLTIEDATKGENKIEDILLSLKPILNKLKNSKELSIQEIETISKEMFNTEFVGNNLYKFNINMINGMVLDLTAVKGVYIDNELKDIKILLTDITYGIPFTVEVSVKDFHELFKVLIFSQTPQFKKEKK